MFDGSTHDEVNMSQYKMMNCIKSNTDCIVFEVRAEAEETVDDLDMTIDRDRYYVCC